MERFELFRTLTATQKPKINEQLILDFASSFDWKPSYYMPSTNSFINYHVVVEHGLHNTAILSFLNRAYNTLTYQEIKELLNLSYNSIIEWSIPISISQIHYLYNRNYEKKEVGQYEIKSDINFNHVLSSGHFEKIKENKPPANIPFLDDILIETIQNWQNILKSKIPEIKEDALSNFINTIILFRAIEDKNKPAINSDKILLHLLKDNQSANKISDILNIGFQHLHIDLHDKTLINNEKLKLLDIIPLNNFLPLVKEFYFNKYKDHYYYDFSVISKNALSRIYEKYVTILRTSEEEDLFGGRIVTRTEKSPGLAYTPEYLARFFAKYILRNYPLITTEPVNIAEPAIGSGIFLRNILEIIDERYPEIFKPEYFKNIFGNDVDNNAVNASKLSLSLLYLSIFGNLPNDINIVNKEAIEYLGLNKELHNTFDIVVSNPPFIRVEEQNPKIKEKLKTYLLDLKKGRTDTYLGFLKIGIDLLKDEGLGLFILPSSFLTNEAGAKIRKELYEKCTIKLICDLSPIQVFENKSVYVILLIFVKGRRELSTSTVMKCKYKVGEALEDALASTENINANYEVFSITQNNFAKDAWYLLNKKDQELKEKIERHPQLSDYAIIKQGVVTGDDPIFITKTVPKNENKIYRRLIPDRNIMNFDFNKRDLPYVIYPYINGKELTERELKKYPKTYKHLEARKSKGGKWWLPHRSRKDNILNPKIITPYLSITPKFALDKSGEYLVTRSPFIFLRKDIPSDTLYYLLGILNSSLCYWYLGLISKKFNQSYNKVEVGDLEELRIPSPTLNQRLTGQIIDTTKRVLKTSGMDKLKAIDDVELFVNELYNIKPDLELTLL